MVPGEQDIAIYGYPQFDGPQQVISQDYRACLIVAVNGAVAVAAAVRAAEPGLTSPCLMHAIADADLENSLEKCKEAESAAAAVPAASADGGAIVEVSLEAPGQEKQKLPPPPTLVSPSCLQTYAQHTLNTLNTLSNGLGGMWCVGKARQTAGHIGLQYIPPACSCWRCSVFWSLGSVIHGCSVCTVSSAADHLVFWVQLAVCSLCSLNCTVHASLNTLPSTHPPACLLLLSIITVFQGTAAFKCASALGTQLQGKSIAEFDRDKQVYHKHELSPLPFQPPPFYSYATSMLSGTFKVGSAWNLGGVSAHA